METRFTVLLIEIGVALVLQIGILIAILLTVQKSSARMQALAEEVQRRALPTLDAAQSLLTTTKPKIEELIANAAATSATIKSQVERLDATVSDVIDRTRLHVIRADELVTRTMDRVEETTELVHHSVDLARAPGRRAGPGLDCRAGLAARPPHPQPRRPAARRNVHLASCRFAVIGSR